MNKTRGPIHRAGLFLFYKIAEPRVVRILQFGIYVFLTIAGCYVLANPPEQFVGVLGETLTRIFAAFLTVGGLVGALAVLPGIWWLERMGVICLWTGLGLFAIIAISLGVSIVGFCISLALILALIGRWRDIRRYQLAPRAQ